jgi:hypothetical protein
MAVKEKGPVTFKKLWIYLSILVVVAGLWAASEFIFPKKTEESKFPTLFPKLQTDKIQEIQWQRGAEIIHLKKNKRWEIIRPISAGADALVVENVLHTLSSLKPERSFPSSGQALKEFGLDSPGVKLLFLIQRKWFEIQVGNKTAVGNDYYVRSSNSTDLFLVQEFYVRELDRDLLALREKKVKKGP